MAVAFRDGALAELCNSRQRLVDRWGKEIGREIARRLIELHAADPTTLGTLPHADVRVGHDGRTVVQFGSEIQIHCETDSEGADVDCLVVTDITVTEEER